MMESTMMENTTMGSTMMKTILIVDDRVINLEFLAMLLDYAGYRVVRSADGAQALAMARLELPALVISDIAMPVMDGMELVQQLKADPATKAIPVIFYTATYSASEARSMARTLGVAAVLTKPAEPQNILDLVARALGDILVLPDAAAPAQTAPSHQAAPDPGALQQRVQHSLLAASETAAPVQALQTLDLQALSLRLAALLELSITLAAERNVQRLLDLFCRSAQNIMNTTQAAAGMHGNGQPKHFSSYGIDRIDIDALFVISDPAAGLLRAHFASGRALGSATAAPIMQQLSAQLPSSHPLRRRFLMVPVKTAASGWLYLAEKQDGADFTLEDQEIATTLAAQLAPLYENRSLYDAVRQHADQLETEVVQRKRVADQLALSEAGLRHAQILTKSAHIVTVQDGLFESWSKTLPQLIGVTDATMPTNRQAWLTIIEPDDRAKFMACLVAAGDSGARAETNYRVRRSDGVLIELHEVLEPLPARPDSDGKLRWFHTIQDVTEHKKQERKVARLSRVSAVLSGINSAIVRIHDRDALFQEACRIAVNQGAFGMAWVGVLESDESAPSGAPDGRIRAWFSGNPEQRAALPEQSSDLDYPWRIAAREQRTVVCNDIHLEATLLPHCARFNAYRSLAVLPLMLENRAVAVIVLFADEVGVFNQDELKLLKELADDLSFGLQFIAKEERLSYLACYDVLTNLPNRMLLQDRMKQFLQQARSEKSLTCVIMLDLDQFSQLNDALGRRAGDAVLVQVAQRLGTSLAEPVSLARIAGDIFAIAIPALAQAADAAALLEQQILGVFDSAFCIEGKQLRITARAGLALYPDDGRDAETLFKHAEIALKNAKSSDERYLYYSPDMNATIAARLALKAGLQTALEQQQFIVHYQPRVDLISGKIVSAEALIRWLHPQRGIVAPDSFIGLAEETGLIVPIGDWVIAAVCAQQASWQASGVAIVPVAVNLSAVQFKKGDVLQTIQDALRRHGLAKHHIEFELTESIVMSDPEQAALKLQALKELGIKLSLDDFGTGFSSLAYLKRFPFDFVKIDRAFITDITKSDKDAMIATAVIAMGHSLNLRVVAEGVETEGQLDYLRQHDCDEIQGYFFSRPVPASAFEAMLRENKCLAPQD
jgi:diguanylate cyclase (GGDEF)-like protein/PAS domain S-box-containing protein